MCTCEGVCAHMRVVSVSDACVGSVCMCCEGEKILTITTSFWYDLGTFIYYVSKWRL